MNIVRLPVFPKRAIYLEGAGNGEWTATFAGDNWSGSFRTERGDHSLVIDRVCQADLRRGLPIDDPAAPSFPLPADFACRYARDPWLSGDGNAAA